jgi:vacuolar-type H+-ATPase subunit I/STV1
VYKYILLRQKQTFQNLNKLKEHNTIFVGYAWLTKKDIIDVNESIKKMKELNPDI